MPERRPILPPFESLPADAAVAVVDAEALDAEAAAALLGIGRSSFLSLDRDGQIPSPAIRIGRIVRWSRRELLAWIDAGAPPRARWAAMWPSLRRRAS